MTKKLEMTQDEQQAWVREQYLKATKYLAQKGLVTESVADTESRYLIPLMAVWKINLIDKTKVWVISGDLPTDHLVLEENESARNVLRHFTFKWQIQADGLLKSDSQEQVDYAKLLMSKAEGLYQLYAKDDVWA
ncbi:MAG: DUF4826 family protein [Colwellia polaris]|jgi:hypothetical protein|uniref:DUF4826 family protein n=1 Tax=Colwellia polaris TaxID=326537 RepID=UPI001E41E69A|nr:DUF4826 family protein [Colwellia polaris]|tara:strand:- start:13377 stop:13778 length:402 start_codon:yes stop_codon:yes gene_type:complete